MAYEMRKLCEAMRKLTMFITAVCVLFLIKLQWPKGPVIIYRRGGGGGGGGLGLNKGGFFLADSPFERYFTEVIPSNNI